MELQRSNSPGCVCSTMFIINCCNFHHASIGPPNSTKYLRVAPTVNALFFSFGVGVIWQRHLAAAPASKFQRQHGHTSLAPASRSHTLQQHQHPSSKQARVRKHLAGTLEHQHPIPAAAQLPSALCSGSSAQAPKCTQQRLCSGTSTQARARTHAALPTLNQQRRPAAAPAPRFENAHTQLFIYLK